MTILQADLAAALEEAIKTLSEPLQVPWVVFLGKANFLIQVEDGQYCCSPEAY